MTGGRPYDILIAGGGINGTGIARDAAGRGLRVLLVEEDDLASGTSFASSKLVHGGLRYLEQGEFRLVREALAERERLIAIAPHLVTPLAFVLPHAGGIRPAWMLRAGLFLYDRLARRSILPPSRALDLRADPAGAPLKPVFRKGFAYSDARVDDSRLVVANALDAQQRGATIRTRCALQSARAVDGLWSATIGSGEASETVLARIVVNAAGPWVEPVLRHGMRREPTRRVRLVKGSHLVVGRLYPGDHAYILQNADRRVVFLIPFEDRFTLIGTTDLPFEGDARRVAVALEEVAYLRAAASAFLSRGVERADVVWSYAGVRALCDDDSADPAAVTRDYALDVSGGGAGPPALSVVGGKLTTYRRLAEQALERLAPFLPGLKPPWTGEAPLPGGDLPRGDLEAFLAEVAREWPWLPAATARRLARSYGTRVHELLAGARRPEDMGQEFGAGLTEREVSFLLSTEWAETPEDILWRRSKLGLHGGPALAQELAARLGRTAGPALPGPFLQAQAAQPVA